MNSFNELFESVKRACQADPKVSDIGYQRWIAKIEAIKLEGGKAYLQAENDFQRRTVEDYYMDVLKRAFEQVLGFPVVLM